MSAFTGVISVSRSASSCTALFHGMNSRPAGMSCFAGHFSCCNNCSHVSAAEASETSDRICDDSFFISWFTSTIYPPSDRQAVLPKQGSFSPSASACSPSPRCDHAGGAEPASVLCEKLTGLPVLLKAYCESESDLCSSYMDAVPFRRTHTLIGSCYVILYGTRDRRIHRTDPLQ